MFKSPTEKFSNSGKKKHGFFNMVKILKQVKEFITTALIVWFATAAILEASSIPTGSMENTIMIGDFLLINKFIYGPTTPRYIPLTNIPLPYLQLPSIREPERNDIVVFEYPGDRDVLKSDKIDFYVKRCIGLPGDTILIYNKVLFINGKEFPIPTNILYLNPNIISGIFPDSRTFPVGANWNSDNYGPYLIPKKGDIIHLSEENIQQWCTLIDREYGRHVVNLKNGKILIDGISAEKYIIQKDYYFMMGDNRDNSADSRYWGLVPRDKIVGQPIMVLWSWNTDIPYSDILRLIGSIRWSRLAKLVK